MEGIPESVSAVTRTTFTNLLPLDVYSTKYIADITPKGTAITRVSKMANTVSIKAGTSETLSDVYFHSKRPGVRFGIPIMRMYPTIIIRIAAVKNDASLIKQSITIDDVFLRGRLADLAQSDEIISF